MLDGMFAAGMTWISDYKSITFWMALGMLLVVGRIAVYWFDKNDAAKKRCIAYQRAEQASAYQAWRNRVALRAQQQNGQPPLS